MYPESQGGVLSKLPRASDTQDPAGTASLFYRVHKVVPGFALWRQTPWKYASVPGHLKKIRIRSGLGFGLALLRWPESA